MTDQTTPVTDDDREAHVWANEVSDDSEWGRIQAVVRAIRAHVPAPPATLADELRAHAKWERDIGATGHSADLYALANRVEAVEVENVSLRIERDQADYLMKKADRELDESRAAEKAVQRACDDWEAEARKVRGDLDEARGEVAAWMKVYQALTDQHTATVAALDEARAEVERLTRGRTSKDSLPVALTDPADVPAGEAWIVEVCGERRPALKDNCPWVPWSTVAGNGVYENENNADVTLVARLVPEADVPDWDHMNHLLEPAGIPTAQPWLVRDGQGLCLGVRQAPGAPIPPWKLLRLCDGTIRRRADADVTMVRPVDISGLDINEVA